MAEPKDLIINNFQSGIADSPHLGFSTIRNLDVTSSPGIAKINYKTQKKSGTVVTDLIRWFVFDNISSFYALGDTGKLYRSTDQGDTWTLVTGNTAGGGGEGLAVWKDYLFAFRASQVDLYGPLSGSPAWTNGWVSFTAANEHPAIPGQDDILYFGAGRYIASVAEKTGTIFAPGNTATYNFNDKALTLPANYNVKCLAELGLKLMIGTYKGTLYYSQKIADIFPWDRSSPTFNLPIRLVEFGINQMIAINNRLYAVAGQEHTVYLTDSTNVQEVRKLGRAMTYNEQYGAVRLDPYPGAIMNHKSKVFTGVSNANAYNAPVGVWSVKEGNVYAGTSSVLLFENQISTGNVVAITPIRIGALISIDEHSYLIGWFDFNTGATGIDKVLGSYSSGGQRYTGYAANFESALIAVGTTMMKKTFREIELELAKPLVTGQGIRISFRKNLSDAYTLLKTWDNTTNPGAQFINAPAGVISDATYVQFKVELTTDTATYTSPELKEIRLR